MFDLKLWGRTYSKINTEWTVPFPDQVWLWKISCLYGLDGFRSCWFSLIWNSFWIPWGYNCFFFSFSHILIPIQLNITFLPSILLYLTSSFAAVIMINKATRGRHQTRHVNMGHSKHLSQMMIWHTLVYFNVSSDDDRQIWPVPVLLVWSTLEKHWSKHWALGNLTSNLD